MIAVTVRITNKHTSLSFHFQIRTLMKSIIGRRVLANVDSSWDYYVFDDLTSIVY